MDAETTGETQPETPEVEQPETPPAEPPAAAVEPETGEEGAGKEAAEEGTEEPKPEGGHKRVGGFQRKIQRLEQEKQMLWEQLQQRQGTPPPGEPAKATPEQEAAKQLEGLFESWSAKREEQRQAQATVADFQRRTQEVRASNPDFDEVVATVDIPTGSALGQAILTSDLGPRMLYELAANPAELARISALPPLVAAREVGRLEARLASGAVPKKAPSAAPRRSAAPAPIAPVTARGPTTVKPPEQMSYEEYSAWRRNQRKR